MKNHGRAGADSRREGVPVAGRRRAGERLVALLLAGAAALNYPLLSVFGGGGLVAGVPVLFVYLFLVWLLLAVGTALALGRRPPERDDSVNRSAADEP